MNRSESIDPAPFIALIYKHIKMIIAFIFTHKYTIITFIFKHREDLL